MKRVMQLFAAAILSLWFAGLASADTLELKDGRVLKGHYLGGTQAVLRFEINGEVHTFNTSEIVAITFTGGSASYAPPMLLARLRRLRSHRRLSWPQLLRPLHSQAPLTAEPLLFLLDSLYWCA